MSNKRGENYSKKAKNRYIHKLAKCLKCGQEKEFLYEKGHRQTWLCQSCRTSNRYVEDFGRPVQ